MKVMEV